MATWLEALAAAQARQTPFVMITLCSFRGSAPGELGARAFVDQTGLRDGTIGGGKLEQRAILHAKAMLQAQTCGDGAAAATSTVTSTNAPSATHAGDSLIPKRSGRQAVTWNLTRDIEMTCGGEVTLLFEVMGTAAMSIALFGAGHVAQALVRTLLPLDCRIAVYDTRQEWLDRLPTHAAVSAVRLDDLASAVAHCDARDMFVVMTRGHATDLPVLAAIYARFAQPRYIGCMGSTVKAARLRRELAGVGVAPELLATFCCPIGLPFGSNSPAEIAISTAAQLLQIRDI